MHPIVIIGAGMAAYSLAREFRKLDKTTGVLLLSSDSAGSYAKPMLSNAFSLGRQPAQLMSHSAQQMAAQLDIEIRGGVRVLAIDRAARLLHTSDGDVAYERLVLALGAQPIRLPLAGNAADHVMSINHLDDYAVFRARLDQLARPARVAILGAGLIGCEFAEDLSAAGHHVTLIDPNPRPLSALAAPTLSHGLLAAWRDRSIALELGTTASAVDFAADPASGIVADPASAADAMPLAGSVANAAPALRVTLASGATLAADIVLSAVGLRPDVVLARAAQLDTARGIVVDRYGRSSDAHIYALGDCAEYSTGSGGGTAVLPYVAPLMTAARAIAATLAGTPTTIDIKADAVIVKTPSYKLALAPPAPGTVGAWVDETDGERTISRYVDEQGRVHGFGLSQHTPALRQGLLAALHRPG